MNRSDLDQLFSATYEELRRLASQVRTGDPQETLNPTALVNEAYLKLAGSPGFQVESPLHFRRIAARAMRQVLVEAARTRSAQKRGGGKPVVTLDEQIEASITMSADVVALDDALDSLATVAPRQAQVVELRYFGGLDLEETAAALDISATTVSRDWRAAKAWLAHEVRSAS